MKLLKFLIPFAIGALICGYFYWVLSTMQGIAVNTSSSKDYSVIISPDDDSAFGWAFARPQINDSLPHIIYRRLEDSITQEIQQRQIDNRSSPGIGVSFGSIGVEKLLNSWYKYYQFPKNKMDTVELNIIKSLDRLSEKQTDNKDNIEFKKNLDSIEMQDKLYKKYLKEKTEKREAAKNYLYYLSLDGYELDYSTKFFLKDSTYNLAYPVWGNSTVEKKVSEEEGHYEKKQIKVRYSTDEKKILIPLTQKEFNRLSNFFSIAGWLSMFLSASFICGVPLLILFNISKGQAFMLQNISLFRYLALFFYVHFY